MNQTKQKLSSIRIVAVILIGLSLAWYLLVSVIQLLGEMTLKAESPYLYRNCTPNQEIFIIGACIVLFGLTFLFNLYAKRKWLTLTVNLILIIALCNPITYVLSFFAYPSCVNTYTIENEAEFNQCAEEMGTDLSIFPKYEEFEGKNVRFVGKVDYGFFFHQSVTAIVEYDSPEQCEADYTAYINSHEFLTEPVIRYGSYLIADPVFDYEGISFQVVTAGEADDFPKKTYMFGMDQDHSALYYLYLDSADLDCVADADAQDLEEEMEDFVATFFNLGK